MAHHDEHTTTTDRPTTTDHAAESEPQYLGVTQMPDGRWAARVPVLRDGQVVYIFAGLHTTAEAAAKAYDRVSRLHNGTRVMLNFPDVLDC